jgi:hypothetical protein
MQKMDAFSTTMFLGELAYPNLMLLAILLTSKEKQRIGNQMNSIAWETDHPQFHMTIAYKTLQNQPTSH